MFDGVKHNHNSKVNAHYNVFLWKSQRQKKKGYSSGESMFKWYNKEHDIFILLKPSNFLKI
jgi:hypothetical protein